MHWKKHQTENSPTLPTMASTSNAEEQPQNPPTITHQLLPPSAMSMPHSLQPHSQTQENQAHMHAENTQSRSNLLTLGQFEFIVQPFHFVPHLFVNPPNAPTVIVEVSQEREPAGARDRDVQYRLLVFPTVQENEHAAVQDGVALPVVKVLSWNSGGVSRPEFVTAARSLIAIYDPHIFVVMGTGIREERAPPITRRLEFDGSLLTSPMGLCGGMWVLWKTEPVDLHRAYVSLRTLHLEVTMRREGDAFLLPHAIYNHPHQQDHLQAQDQIHNHAGNDLRLN